MILRCTRVAGRGLKFFTCAAVLVAATPAAFAQVPAAPTNVRVYVGDPTVPNVTLTVSPATANVQPGGVVSFTATVTGSTNTSVLWTSTGGSISPAGIYTAGSSTGTFRVTATLSGGTISGSATVTIQSPTNATIEVSPGQNIQTAVNSVPEGAIILIKAGIHRLQSIVPRNRQTIVGEQGAILSGARLLTSFIREGSAWVATGQTQQGTGYGECWATSPRCGNPEDLFIDNVRLNHVASLSAGGPGRWFFDYGTDKIYFWDDPTGRRVETSVTPVAFDGPAADVTVKNLIIEKYASPGQHGAIKGGARWLLELNEVRFNHGIGIHMRDGRRVLYNNLHHNGQMGIGGSSTGAVVEGNDIAYNNAAGYNSYWEAGGSKFTFSRNLVLRRNFVHHNDGPGLWTDIDNIDILIESNRVEDNNLSGIFHEIGFRATIRNNTVSRNGRSRPNPWWIDGAGILVSSSSDVEVYGNTLVDNFQGITGLEGHRGDSVSGLGPWVLRNLYVHDNNVTQTGTLDTGSGRSGIVDTNGTSAFTSSNNRYASNTYRLPASVLRSFMWMGRDVTDAEWRGYGQDVTGTFTR
jgi:hypothetical protein